MINLIKVFYFRIKISLLTHSLFIEKYVIEGVFSNNLIFSTDLFVYKVKYNDSRTLFSEISNYEKVKFMYVSKGLPFVHTDFSTNKSKAYLKLRKMVSIDKNEYFNAFQSIFNSFSYFDSQKKCNEETLKFVYISLNLLKPLIENVDYIKIESFLNSIIMRPLSIGLCHGDLHTRNIMKDQLGNYKIIDLDCIRYNGIRDVEIIYFVSELLWEENNKNWKDNLLNLLLMKEDFPRYHELLTLNLREAIFIFFLDRFGQDFLYYKEYSKDHYTNFCDSLLLIINSDKKNG
jgi:hypothetical protein